MHSSYANLIQPKPGDPVMRYTTLAQLLWILVERKLPLIPVDLFRDPFEGSVPKSEIDVQGVIAGKIHSDYVQSATLSRFYPEMSAAALSPRRTSGEFCKEMTARRKALIRSSHASCWRRGPESEGMWRLYCGERDGVALCTTFDRLEKSIADNQLLAGSVRYETYDTMPPFNDPLDPLMHKRRGFEFENEVRLLRVDQEHYKELCAGNQQPELRPCVPIDWCPKTAVERILISPYAEDWYKEVVETVVHKLEPGLQIEWSELRATPNL